MRRAFTLIETLVAIAIIALLAAISYAVFSNAKKSAITTTCMSNLHQYAVAISLYRADWESAEFGDKYQMGMPPNPWALTGNLHCPLMGLPNPTLVKNPNYIYLVPDPGSPAAPSWLDRVHAFGLNTVILDDFNHADPVDLGKPYFPHLGIGLTLGGGIIKKRQAGQFSRTDWWQPQGG